MNALPMSGAGYDGCAASPASSSASLAPEPRVETTLLSHLFTAGDHDAVPVRINARVVDASGHQCCHNGLRLAELVRALWPSAEKPEAFRDMVRRLKGNSKRQFFIRPTSRAILVRTDILAAVIEPSRALLFETDNPLFQTFCDEFARSLGNIGDRCFDMWAVECAVCASVTLHTMRFETLKYVITQTLQRMDCGISEGSILQLHPLKQALKACSDKFRPMVECLHSVLRVDIDHDAGYDVGNARAVRTHSDLSSLREDDLPSFSSGWHRSLSSVTDDEPNHAVRRALEDVLDTWVHNADEMVAESAKVNESIDDAFRFLEASLSYMRNHLLKFELVASVVSLVMTLGALISGIFGMNLKNGREEESGWFFIVVCVILVLGMFFLLGFRLLYKRIKGRYRCHATRFGENRFFENIANDMYVLRLTHPTGMDLERVDTDLQQHATVLTPSTSGRSFEPWRRQSLLASELGAGRAPGDAGAGNNSRTTPLLGAMH